MKVVVRKTILPNIKIQKENKPLNKIRVKSSKVLIIENIDGGVF